MNVASRKACLFGKGHTAGMALIPAGAFKMGDTLNGENKPKPTVNVIYETAYLIIACCILFAGGATGQTQQTLTSWQRKYRLTPPHHSRHSKWGLHKPRQAGRCLLFRGPYHRAIQDFDQAIRLKPNDASFFFYHRSIVLIARKGSRLGLSRTSPRPQSQEVQIYNQNTSSMIVGPNYMPNRGITMAIMEVRMKYIGFGNAGLNAGLMNNLGHR